MSDAVYENPLITRYASKEMARLLSTEHRIGLWRQLWIVLAETQKELGLSISDTQLSQLKAFQNTLTREDFERLLTTVFTTGGAWRNFIEIDDDEARIRTGDAETSA
ncbi:MAG: hypothetical protein WCP62_15030, partial [Planctomycetota bacterium]